MDDQRLLSFIDLVYSCSNGQEDWSTFLARFDEAFPALKSGMSGYDRHSAKLNFALAGNYDPTLLESYIDYYAAINPWTPFMESLPPLSQDFWSYDTLTTNDLKKTEFYNDWLCQQDGIDTGFAMPLFQNSDRFLVMSCNFNSKHRDEALAARHLLRTLEPHLRRAFEIYRQLDGARLQIDTLESVLARQSAAILVIDEERRLIHANERAEDLLRAGRILSLGPTGVIRFCLADDQKAIEEQIRHVNGEGYAGASAVRLGVPREAPFFALVTPVTQEDKEPRTQRSGLIEPVRQVMITLIDPAHEPLKPERLIRLAYNLSPAQARLALALLRGNTLHESADLFGITYETVRSQLKSLFEKTEVNSQSELIRNLSKLVDRSI